MDNSYLNGKREREVLASLRTASQVTQEVGKVDVLFSADDGEISGIIVN